MKITDVISKIKELFFNSNRFGSEALYDNVLTSRNKHKAEFEKLYETLSPVEKQEFQYLNAMNQQPSSILLNKHYFTYKTLNEVLHKIELSEVSK